MALSGIEKSSLLQIVDTQNPPAHFSPFPVHGLPWGHMLNSHTGCIGLFFSMYLVGAWEKLRFTEEENGALENMLLFSPEWYFLFKLFESG